MDANFLKHIEAMKAGALGLCGEVTKMIETTMEKGGPEAAKQFKEELKSSKAMEMMQEAMKDITNFNNTKF